MLKPSSLRLWLFRCYYLCCSPRVGQIVTPVMNCATTQIVKCLKDFAYGYKGHVQIANNLNIYMYIERAHDKTQKQHLQNLKRKHGYIKFKNILTKI